jgi:hypothetical protein
VPASDDRFSGKTKKTWMPGTSPGMMIESVPVTA